MSIEHLDPRAVPGTHTGAPSVRRVRVVRHLGRRRIVLDAELPGRGGPLRVEVLRHGELLVERTWAWIGPGHQVLRIAVPRSVRAGSAVVRLDTAAPARVFVPAR